MKGNRRGGSAATAALKEAATGWAAREEAAMGDVEAAEAARVAVASMAEEGKERLHTA
jgi:hypothetical protein